MPTAGAPGVGADWFGPGAPLPPMAPQDVKGRSWDFPFAYNQQQQKRPGEAIGWATLRALADSYDVLRAVIETRKDQMARQRPAAVPKDPTRKVEDDAALKARIEEATKLIQEPYPGMEWAEWLRRVLEDMFVLDAPAVYIRRNRVGGVYGLKPIDGATINRVLDPFGDTPDPPAAAYVQILKGVGAVHYTRDELIYRPRNPRNGKAFGFGPVEQIIMIINIALRREGWQLGYFTEGNMPDALIGVPMEWTPDQIRNFQDWFDARLAGELGKRRGATFVPGDVAKGYVPTKETELFGKAEEWMARVVCYAFSVSPQGFVMMMNKATADTAQETATEEGLAPIMDWVAGLWNRVFRMLGWDDIELGWKEEDDTDPKTQAEIQNGLVKEGVKTRNEARKALGEDPDPSPEADMLMITTATGAVPLSLDAQLEHEEKKIKLMPPPAPPGGAAGGGSSSRSGGSGSGSARGGAGSQGQGGKAPPPKPKPKPKGGKTTKAVDGTMITLGRPAARRAKAALKRAWADALREAGDDVAAQVSKALMHAGKARKADEPEQADPSGSVGHAVDVTAIVRGVDLSSLEVTVDVTEEALYDLASDSALKALAQVGVRDVDQLVDRVNEAAVAYAKERAAELVGKRFNAAGELVDNPSPKWAITQSTRDGLRDLIAKGLEDNIGRPAIADLIQESYLFSAERAETISLTEIAFANEEGKMEGWRAAQDEGGVVLKKGWQTSNDEAEVCDECRANEDQGLIGLEEDFESGDDAAPAHPNCQCVTYVEVEQAEGGDE